MVNLSHLPARLSIMDFAKRIKAPGTMKPRSDSHRPETIMVVEKAGLGEFKAFHARPTWYGVTPCIPWGDEAESRKNKGGLCFTCSNFEQETRRRLMRPFVPHSRGSAALATSHHD